jgi:glutamyl/glutaminyl-tRNA synthetase
MTSLTTRFAPSPTGYLHLGHVVNAIYVWGIAHLSGARVLLRIEDHDRIRCRPEYEPALLEDLAWLGFTADAPLTRQSERGAIYAAALERLRRTQHVFACDCSRKDLAGDTYGGRCRTRGLEDGPGRGLRVQECGDLLIRDRDGHWTYQLCVVADDIDQGVNLIIRGDDLRSSTSRQRELGRMLGREDEPSYVHHPLLLKPSGKKLSKASGDTGIRELRQAGLSAAEVIGQAAAGAGLLASPAPIAAADVYRLLAGDTFTRSIT